MDKEELKEKAQEYFIEKNKELIISEYKIEESETLNELAKQSIRLQEKYQLTKEEAAQAAVDWYKDTKKEKNEEIYFVTRKRGKTL